MSGRVPIYMAGCILISACSSETRSKSATPIGLDTVLVFRNKQVAGIVSDEAYVSLEKKGRHGWISHALLLGENIDHVCYRWEGTSSLAILYSDGDIDRSATRVTLQGGRIINIIVKSNSQCRRLGSIRGSRIPRANSL